MQLVYLLARFLRSVPRNHAKQWGSVDPIMNLLNAKIRLTLSLPCFIQENEPNWNNSEDAFVMPDSEVHPQSRPEEGAPHSCPLSCFCQALSCCPRALLYRPTLDSYDHGFDSRKVQVCNSGLSGQASPATGARRSVASFPEKVCVVFHC